MKSRRSFLGALIAAFAAPALPHMNVAAPSTESLVYGPTCRIYGKWTVTNPLVGITRIWSNGKLIFDASRGDDPKNIPVGTVL